MKHFCYIVALNLAILSFASCVKAGDEAFNRGMKAYSKAEYEEALNAFDTALDLPCNYSKEIIYSMKANIYLARQDFLLATSSLESALSYKEDYRILTTLGSVYHNMEQDDKAITTYEKAIALQPKSPEAYGALGALYLGQGNIENALSLLQKAQEINPKIAVIHGNLAICYASKKDSASCKEQLLLATQYGLKNINEFNDRVEEILQEN